MTDTRPEAAETPDPDEGPADRTRPVQSRLPAPPPPAPPPPPLPCRRLRRHRVSDRRPFAYGTWKEPWIVPRRKTAAIVIACVAAVLLLGIGMISGAALRGGGGGDHRSGPRFERNGAGQFPGPGQLGGQFPGRHRPGYFPRPGIPASTPATPTSPARPAPSSSYSPGDQPPPPSEPTARAMTSSDVSRAAVASTPMRIFARLVNGIVSVGLNALELVSDRYR